MRSNSPKAGLRHRSAAAHRRDVDVVSGGGDGRGDHEHTSQHQQHQQQLLLDEQEQDDVVRLLRSDAIRQAESIGRKVCLASVVGSVVAFTSTLLYASILFLRRSASLDDAREPVAEDSTFANEARLDPISPCLPSKSLIFLVALFGFFSTWMHLVAAYLGSGGVSIGRAIRCGNPEISQVMSFLRKDGFQRTHCGIGGGLSPANAPATSTPGKGWQLHLFGGLGVMIPFLWFAYLNGSSSSMSSSFADVWADFVAFSLFQSTFNMFTMFAAIVVRRDTSSTLASVDELERSKYRYKSL